MNVITKHIHIWRLDLPLLSFGEFIRWKTANCRLSFIFLGHAIRIYR